MAVSHIECSNCGVQITEDGKESDRLGKRLAALANSRGWLFDAEK